MVLFAFNWIPTQLYGVIKGILGHMSTAKKIKKISENLKISWKDVCEKQWYFLENKTDVEVCAKQQYFQGNIILACTGLTGAVRKKTWSSLHQYFARCKPIYACQFFLFDKKSLLFRPPTIGKNVKWCFSPFFMENKLPRSRTCRDKEQERERERERERGRER